MWGTNILGKLNGASTPHPELALSLLSQIFGSSDPRDRLRPLYLTIVALGRDPIWYRAGQVPDTVTGRFDMIAALVALVLLRMEREGEALKQDTVHLTELFIDDMDGSLRQIGIGDLVVGKQMGKMMSALGGRLASFRTAIGGQGTLEGPVRRNIFHEAPPSPEALAFVSGHLEAFQRKLADTEIETLMAGGVPKP